MPTCRAVFEVMSRAAGINFVLDREVQGDAKVNIFVRNTPIEDVLKVLLLTNQLEHKVLNDNSVLVFPSTPAKQREYQDLVVRSFYLTNADAKQTQAMLKAVIKAKDIYIDEKLNMLVLRDTPEAIRVAEKLVAAQDLAEPEVVLDLEVLEVQRAKLQALGSAVSERDPARAGAHPATGAAATTVPSLIQLGKGGLQAFVTNPAIIAQLRQELDERQPARQSEGARQEPREGEGADRPEAARVHHHVDCERGRVHQRELPGRGPQARARTAGLSRRRSVDEGEPGSEQRHPGAQQRRHAARHRRTRSAHATRPPSLRLKDGETQALAGLIQDEDTRTFNNVPGLANMPVIGRLFSSQGIDAQKNGDRAAHHAARGAEPGSTAVHGVGVFFGNRSRREHGAAATEADGTGRAVARAEHPERRRSAYRVRRRRRWRRTAPRTRPPPGRWPGRQPWSCSSRDPLRPRSATTSR